MTPTDVTLRSADEGEGEAIASVYLRSRGAAAMPPSAHTDDAVRYWLDGRLQRDEVWVAEVEGLVVGYTRLTDTWLDDLYVVPECSGRGIGTLLLDLAKAQRPQGFCLWVFESNRPARDFYAGRGLLELERTDGLANEEQSPDIRFAWPGHDPLTFLRELIDEVDDQLADLLARRVALTAAVQPHKQRPGRDAERERAIADRLTARVPVLGSDRLTRIVDVIVTESLDATGH